MKYLNPITDMTSTGNSMGKLFETPYAFKQMEAQFRIKLQSILAKTNWKREMITVWFSEDNKEEEESQLNCAIEPLGGEMLWFPQTLRKFKTQEWRDWVKRKICLNCRLWTSRIWYFKTQNIFLVSSKENDEVLKVLRTLALPDTCKAAKE